MRRRLGILLVLTLSVVAGCFGADAEPLPARVTAFLEADAADDPGPVEERVRAIAGVTAVDVVTREEAYARFAELMQDRPDLVREASPDTMPASLEVTVSDGSIAEVVELVIGALDGVDDTVLAMGDGDVKAQEYTGVILRLSADATDEQRDAVNTLVRALPGTKSISFETADQARERLRKRCGDRKDLASAFESVTPRDVPASFRFRMELDRARDSDLDPTKQIDGVDDLLFVPAEVV